MYQKHISPLFRKDEYISSDEEEEKDEVKELKSLSPTKLKKGTSVASSVHSSLPSKSIAGSSPRKSVAGSTIGSPMKSTTGLRSKSGTDTRRGSIKTVSSIGMLDSAHDTHRSALFERQASTFDSKHGLSPLTPGSTSLLPQITR